MSDFSNPYAPPNADLAVQDELPSLDLIDASQGVRFGNMLLDSAASFFCMMLLAVVFLLLGVSTEVAGNLVGIGGMVSYYLFFEGVFGRTPGKWITGTRVVREDGGKPRFTQILGRTFARMVPFEAFSFLGSDRGWHDRWSGTRVVTVRR